MGGTPHWRRGHLAWLQAAARTSAAERERCAAIVERWNAAPTHDWSPAIGTALKAGYRWLDVYCGGCRQVKLGRSRQRRHTSASVPHQLDPVAAVPPVRRPRSAAEAGWLVAFPAVGDCQGLVSSSAIAVSSQLLSLLASSSFGLTAAHLTDPLRSAATKRMMTPRPGVCGHPAATCSPTARRAIGDPPRSYPEMSELWYYAEGEEPRGPLSFAELVLVCLIRERCWCGVMVSRSGKQPRRFAS
jgi:hypothetical protein